MKAEFKRTRTADGLPLTFGKMYDVLDVKAGKKPWQLKEIKVKNDLGQERWYSANKFKLFAEAAAFLKEPTAGAGQAHPAGERQHPARLHHPIRLRQGADRGAGPLPHARAPGRIELLGGAGRQAVAQEPH